MPRIGLFPGQGAQSVGMLRHSLSLPSVQALCKLAQETLGYDLASLCQSGPQDKLNRTVFCQPATLLSSLASFERYKSDAGAYHPLSSVSGFSVGEIPALVASNSISCKDAFLFVKSRAEAMQAASDAYSSAMLSVSGLSTEMVQEELDSVNRESTSKFSAVIGSYLTQNICSVSVGREDVPRLLERFRTLGAKKVSVIPVSGAFHSGFMSLATDKIENIVERMEISTPSIPTYSNNTGRPYESVSEIKSALPLQMTRPVLWNGIMSHLLSSYTHPKFVEVGYGTQLSSILARIDRNAFKLAIQIPP